MCAIYLNIYFNIASIAFWHDCPTQYIHLSKVSTQIHLISDENFRLFWEIYAWIVCWESSSVPRCDLVLASNTVHNNGASADAVDKTSSADLCLFFRKLQDRFKAFAKVSYILSLNTNQARSNIRLWNILTSKLIALALSCKVHNSVSKYSQHEPYIMLHSTHLLRNASLTNR